MLFIKIIEEQISVYPCNFITNINILYDTTKTFCIFTKNTHDA